MFFGRSWIQERHRLALPTFCTLNFQHRFLLVFIKLLSYKLYFYIVCKVMKNFVKGIIYYCKDGLFSVIILCEPKERELNNLYIFVGWASRPSLKDGRDAHPTRTIKILSYLILIPKRVRNLRSQSWEFAIPKCACVEVSASRILRQKRFCVHSGQVRSPVATRARMSNLLYSNK
jgi:hypothetical protein